MLRVALVGYGYWGPNVARNIYKNKNLELTYICDLKQDRLDLARQLYVNDVLYTTEIEDVLADEAIDMVALAVETSAHYELGKRVLEVGKHLYVEKPFTDNIEQARELRGLANHLGLKIHVDHIMVYHPAITKIKEIIRSGELGDIIYYDCSRMNLGKVKNDVSCMWDLSVHDLSIIDYLSDGQEAKNVTAMGKHIYSQRESVSFLTVQYESFIATVKANWISPIKERKLIVAGTKKMLVYDDVEVLNKLIVYDKGFDVISKYGGMEYEDFVIRAREGDAVIPKLESGDALFNSIEHFRSCIEGGHKSRSDPDAAIRVIKILEMADEAMISI